MTAFGVVPEHRAEPDPLVRNRITWQKRIAWSDLPCGARCLGLVLALYTDDHGTTAIWLTLADLARLTGLSSATVRRYLELLVEAGWIVQAARGRGNWNPKWLAWPGDTPITRRAELAEASR